MRFLQFPKSSLTLAQEFFPGDYQRIYAIYGSGSCRCILTLTKKYFSQQHWKQFE